MNQITKSEEKEIMFHVVDPDGVIVQNIYAGDKIVHEDDKKPIDTTYFGFNKDKKFVKLYSGVSELSKRLTNPEFKVAIAISDYVSYGDCCLKEGGHGNGKILTNVDLAEKMAMNYDQFRKIMTSLRKKRVLGVFLTGKKDKTITVNPYIYTRGKDVNKTVITYFENSEWAHLLR